MMPRSNRNRIKILNKLAAAAALAVVLGSISHSEQSKIRDRQEALAQEETDSPVDGTVSELVSVAVAAAKPFTFSISSLIFRF